MARVTFQGEVGNVKIETPRYIVNSLNLVTTFHMSFSLSQT